MKYFEIKLYSQKGEFKKQINTTSDINFSEQLDGGQSNLNLEIIGNSTDFNCSDIIEIREVNIGVKLQLNYWDDSQIWDDSKIWDDGENPVISTYTGIIEKIGVTEYKNKEVLNLEIYGVFTALNDIIYKSGTNKVFTKTDTIGNIAKDIIDYFNSQYGNLNGDTQNIGLQMFFYTLDSIDTGSSVSIEFDNNNCLEALKKLLENTDFNFYINENGKVFVKSENIIKYLTFDKEIVSIEKTLKKDEMVNKYYLSRSGDVEKVYTDTGSITNFNLKELSESNTSIQDEATQDIKGNSKINDYSGERFEVSLTIKTQKNSFLQPGFKITTQNTKNQIIEEKITKIQKNKDFWIISLGDFKSFGKTILKK